MPYEITVKANYFELVDWLSVNVGPVTSEGTVINHYWKNKYISHPFSCFGKNWSIHSVGLTDPITFRIRVYDEKLATMIGLRWI